jgi:Acyl-CoA reductase (LuxC)
MILAEKNIILSKLGTILGLLGDNEPWSGYDLGINESEYTNLNELIQRVHVYNGWFKENEVRKALKGLSTWLDEGVLNDWQSAYDIKETKPKRVGLILAGNIPLVGFHDFISVFLSGNISVIKMSSDDKHLFPAILKTMALFDETIWEWVELSEAPMKDFDAVIATGSDNSARYFESYFGKHPNIIRKNRSSIAVLDGTESEDELFQLGNDIFDFFGLGCRNVSQIWIPEDFVLDRFFEAIYDHNEIVNHNKYANNYDYNKAVFLMNLEQILDNGFVILKESKDLHSPLAVVHYVRYKDRSEVDKFIEEKEDQIQLIVGKGYEKFGNAQCPKIDDYADGVDTLKFLTSL